jgi:hypothetical protein
MDTAKTLASTHFTASKSAADITKAFRDAFPNIKHTYPDSAAETWAAKLFFPTATFFILRNIFSDATMR